MFSWGSAQKGRTMGGNVSIQQRLLLETGLDYTTLDPSIQAELNTNPDKAISILKKEIMLNSGNLSSINANANTLFGNNTPQTTTPTSNDPSVFNMAEFSTNIAHNVGAEINHQQLPDMSLNVTGATVEKPDPQLAGTAVMTKEEQNQKALNTLHNMALKDNKEIVDGKTSLELMMATDAGQAQNRQQWELYFAERYKQNPDEKERDIVKVFFRKEVFEAKAALKEMNNTPATKQTLRIKYLTEGHASDDEIKAYEEEKARLYQKHVKGAQDDYDKRYPEEATERKQLEDEIASLDPTKDAQTIQEKQARLDELNAKLDKAVSEDLIEEFNTKILPQNQTQAESLIKNTEHLKPHEIEQIIDLLALEKINLTEEKLYEMAVSAVADSKYNKGILEIDKLKKEIATLKKNNLTPEGEKIQNLAIRKDAEFAQKIAKTLVEAETEESLRLTKEMQDADLAFQKQIEAAKLTGNTVQVKELEKQRAEAKTTKLKEIEAARNPQKMAEIKRLEKERADARNTAQTEVYNTLPDKVKKEIKKKEVKIQKLMGDAYKAKEKLLADKTNDIIEVMAETQVEKQLAEIKFKNTKVDFAKLDKDIQEWIKSNPEAFCDEIEYGSTGSTFHTTEELTGVENIQDDGIRNTKTHFWKFNEQKFKDFMLAQSNDYNLDNSDAKDPYNHADYYADLQERNRIIRQRKGDEAAVKSKLSDRRFAAKCYKAAGIEFEGDRSVGKKIGHLAGAFAKGFIVGSVAGAAAEYLSTTKIVKSDFFKLVQISGTVPWTKMIHVEGDAAYHTQVEVSGTATGQVSLDYSGTADYSGTVTGTATGSYSGVASDVVTVTHTDWQNGIPQGTYDQNIQVDIPYSGEVEIPYEQGYSGSVGYSGTATGEASIGYHQVVDVDGTVHWEKDVEVSGEAEYHREEEVRGTTSGRPDINFGNIMKIGIASGVANVLRELPGIGKVKDEGMRDKAIRRQVLAEKGVDEPPKPPVPQPKKPQTVEIPEYDVIGNDGTKGTPEKTEIHTEEVNVKKGYKRNGTVHYWGWKTLANAYEVPNTKEFRNWFRETYLNGNDIWTAGATQHFEKEITFNGKTYDFNKATFEAEALDTHTPRKGQKGSASHGGTNKRETVTPAVAGQDGNWKVIDKKTKKVIKDGFKTQEDAQKHKKSLEK